MGGHRRLAARQMTSVVLGEFGAHSLASATRGAQNSGMIPGPDYILACPHCGAFSRIFTIMEADPTGTISWTDGYQHTPNTPRHPNLIRCHQCGALHWLGEAAQIGMIDPPEMVPAGGVPRFAILGQEEQPEPGTPPPQAWLEAPHVATLGEQDYFEALHNGMALTPEQEIELRVHAWWRGNDRFRTSEGAGRHPTSPEAIENLQRLVELTEDGDHELMLFHAEALRQLGRFDQAEEALFGLCSDYALAREKMLELLRERSRDLEVMFV
jgi:hypothetical protein